LTYTHLSHFDPHIRRASASTKSPSLLEVPGVTSRSSTIPTWARRAHAALTLAALLGATACAPAAGQHNENSVLRVVPGSDLAVLDPIWTTATISQNHGFMIYDTLFGMTAEGRIQPQMVDSHETSPDGRTWTFRLRDGLEFHDGQPVTSEDVVASLQRWGRRDSMGQKLLSFVEQWEALDARTFRLRLSTPYGLVLESLGKPSANVPFIMPRRVAATPADRQIDDYTGSGPFIFEKDEWRPGEKVVYVRNTRYAPRADAATGTAGGKIARVDRVEWLIITDPQTQANALATGEVDMIEMPAFELYRSMQRNPDIQLLELNPLGGQNYLRFNHLEPPFDNPKVRRAAMAALNQEMFLQAQVGDPRLYRTCFSVYPCKTPYATAKGMAFIAEHNLARARQLLEESGYSGTAIIVLQPTDIAISTKLPVVAAQHLRQAGFVVDMQPMNWQSLVSRRAGKTGWHIFITNSPGVSQNDPIVNFSLNADCGKAWFGWPCDAELERLRDAFARARDDDERKAMAEQVQLRAMEIGTHVPLGEYVLPTAARKNVTGLLPGPQTMILWNVAKQ
jgi:peptide/nickel transport system substrate-binding protein